MHIWRVSEHIDLSGRGGDYVEQRWNYRGDRIVYCCEHPALAMLEILVNTDFDTVPDTYQLLQIRVLEGLAAEKAELPENWRDDISISQAFWRDFITENRACILAVPSIIMPFSTNYLINPSHPDHVKLTITGTARYPFDARLKN